jgi:hypothetical protein
MLDAKISTTHFKLPWNELRSIISDHTLWNTEVIDNALQELDRCILRNTDEWLGFCPLDECVDDYEDVLVASFGLG